MTELNLNFPPPPAPQQKSVPGLYLEPHQTRDRAPTAHENAIADVIERCYAAGIHDRASLVAELNRADVAGPDGKPWTEASFEAEMKRLGA